MIAIYVINILTIELFSVSVALVATSICDIGKVSLNLYPNQLIYLTKLFY